MKVEIAENHGGAEITCWSGPEEVKVTHKELKTDPEGNPLDELDLMVTLLDAASAAVGSIPRPVQPPPEGGETKSERLEREENNRKALAEWRTERERIELEEEEAMYKKAADAQAQAAEAKTQAEPQPEQPQPDSQWQGNPPPSQQEPQPA
jgi:hypothetical protein